MYSSEEEFLALVEQALGRDIRSVHQRLGGGSGHAPSKEGRGAARSAAATPGGAADGSAVRGSGTGTQAGHVTEPKSHPSPSYQPRRGEGSRPGDRAGPLDGASSRGGGRHAKGEESEAQGEREGAGQSQGFYHIVLEGIDISYDVLSTGVVHVRSAVHWQPRQAL